ncbi:flagellar motor switch protein FliG [Patescibacteria group bacterium]|nr:flagellar motor switch protein FliG [Patescibacteria group bacterium]
MAKITLTGPQKAAGLLIIMGAETSASIFKHLDEKEVDKLTLEITKIPNLEREKSQQIIAELRESLATQESMSKGGIEYAREVLGKALGSARAEEIINRSIKTLKMQPFDFMKKADVFYLANFLQKEHPQTIAVILSYLDPQKASNVLLNIPEDKRGDVAKRLAGMKNVSSEFVSSVENSLREKFEKETVTTKSVSVGGVESLVNILHAVDRETEKAIVDALSETEPDLAEEVRKRLFTFDDLKKLDDRALQRILREVDPKDLARAMKQVSGTISGLIYKNMPKRAAEMLKEEISYLGPMRLSEVEEAQQKIIVVVRQLEEQGEIMISRGGKGGESIIE